ncbi:hypothetical protein [Cohnella abietis]|uniref:Uncharacterized protein n=1 Tax=Cohnella abietis TaxID=2507935 RepID=A0A3T1D8U6_9BACL|nr:hypothetical protein [Cohnella abietis]BBI34494.1 hypothetical protein KCTCHS21_38930 [Cohnella abietis]
MAGVGGVGGIGGIGGIKGSGGIVQGGNGGNKAISESLPPKIDLLQNIPYSNRCEKKTKWKYEQAVNLHRSPVA